MSNSEPYCELKKFIFDAKDEGRNPYLQVRWVQIALNLAHWSGEREQS